MPVPSGVGRTTRDYLRSETADCHDRLDMRLGALVEGGEREFSAFLAIQHRARRGIEGWLADHAPDCEPPLQTGLIAQDLYAMGIPVPGDCERFEAPAGSDPLGACWVLAGSSLGNRAILARLGKAGLQRPVAFLSDSRMTAYWKQLRPLLERPHSLPYDNAALAAAQATFSHFNAVAARHCIPVTA